MSPLDLALVAAAGVAAGTINTIVGSGSLVTFPLLVALGMNPVAANITSKLGILPGGIAGAWGYRRELAPLRHLFGPLLATSAAGGLVGALLLLVLPSSTFDAVVPVLIALAGVLVVAQPAIKRWVAARSAVDGSGVTDAPGLKGSSGPGSSGPGTPTARLSDETSAARVTGLSFGLLAGVASVGVYSGYFGAAQGVMFMAVLGLTTHLGMQQQNALKNLTAVASNGMSAVVFVAVAAHHVNWLMAGILAVGAAVGGLLGARVARSLSPTALRWVVAAICLVALVAFLR